MLVPYTLGGGADTTARLLAGPMGAALGQAIVVENRPGAGGSIGAAEVARARPDGLTLMCDASAHVVNPAVLRGLPFDYATAFTPISQVAVIPMVVLVPAKARAATLAELVRDLKAWPGQPYGSAGNATAPHSTALSPTDPARGPDIRRRPELLERAAERDRAPSLRNSAASRRGAMASAPSASSLMPTLPEACSESRLRITQASWLSGDGLREAASM